MEIGCTRGEETMRVGGEGEINAGVRRHEMHVKMSERNIRNVWREEKQKCWKRVRVCVCVVCVGEQGGGGEKT